MYRHIVEHTYKNCPWRHDTSMDTIPACSSINTRSHEVSMGREHLIEESNWLLLSRRRRLTVSDLMVAVALAALAFSVGSLSNLTNGERLRFGLLTFVFLGSQTAQWRIAGIASGQGRPAAAAVPGVLSFVMALSMLVCLIVFGLLFPAEVPLVVGMMLLLAIYLTTWD